MKFALVDNQKVAAQKGLKGICPICQKPVIPKCGPYKIDHWAHKSNANCDKWWENETDWHRKWKNLFPEEWQEVVAFDEITGEKHIADIKTNTGMVIEFQHSNISDDERVSRESFYKKMIWIVDGTRRKYDFSRFMKAFDKEFIIPVDKSNNIKIWLLFCSGDYLPKEWVKSSVPVVFDYGNDELWCLFPKKESGHHQLILETPRDELVNVLRKGQFFTIAEQSIDCNHLQIDKTETKDDDITWTIDHTCANEQETELKQFRENKSKLRHFSYCHNVCQERDHNLNCVYEKNTITYQGKKFVVCNKKRKQYIKNTIVSSKGQVIKPLSVDNSQIVNKKVQIHEEPKSKNLPFEKFWTIKDYYLEVLNSCVYKTPKDNLAKVLKCELIGNTILLLYEDPEEERAYCPFHIIRITTNYGELEQNEVVVYKSEREALKSFQDRLMAMKKATCFLKETKDNNDELPF